MKSDCIILAAGLSSRMGKNKMLLEIDGIPIIERCIHAFYGSCSKIIVVTGKYHEDIRKCLLCLSKINLVHNGSYQQGMFSSVKTGLRHIESNRFFLCPGDYPFLKVDTVNRMSDTAGSFIVPVYQGEQGHPILLDSQFIPMILNSKSDSLRDCLTSISPKKQEVSVNDSGIIRDMDTVEEYNAASISYGG